MSNPEVTIEIFDTTMRDGAQSLPAEHQFPDGSKPEIADAIASLGVSVIEAGFPRTPGDAEEVAEVAKTVGQDQYGVHTWRSNKQTGYIYKSPTIAGLARAEPSDIEAVWNAVHFARNARIHTFISMDKEHMAKRFPGKVPEEIFAMGSQAVKFAKELAADHEHADVEFSAEAASTTSGHFLERVIKDALYQGADVINVPDTVGQRDPLAMNKFYARVIKWVISTNPDAIISAHNHNDFGMAAANTNMLVFAAAKYARKHDTRVRIQLETVVCGLGERAGNADVFPVVAALHKFTPGMGVPITWDFSRDNSVPIARQVMGYAGLTVDRQSPIVGEDVMRHRSGVHSDAIIKGGKKGHKLYTPYNPTDWGHTADAAHEDGKYQGKRGRDAAQ